jgi:hypothetical protein
MDPLKKIKSMTTDIGIYQHGNLNKPDPKFGYALEDQARALIVADGFKEKNLQNTYLDFFLKAQREDGLLYHFYFENKDKGLFKNKEYSSKPKANIKEAYGITLWSLLSLKNNTNNGIKKIVKNLIQDAYNWTSPRAIASALLGLLNYRKQDSLENELKRKLHNLYFDICSNDWQWFENCLVYANAIIPWALWDVYLIRKCRISFEIAKKTTDFLIKNCQENNTPSPIGNNGWYFKGRSKALYDQQPVDAGYMVCCLEKAYHATGNSTYMDWAKKWYGWFWGNNIKNVSLIDKDFACYDALTMGGVNLNQGAESNICFLMAYLADKRLKLSPENC